MNCRQARKLIPYAVDAAADDSVLRQLSEHISGCTACRDLFQLHQAQTAEIALALHKAADQIGLPAGFASQVTAAAASQRPAPRMLDLMGGYVRERLLGLAANRRALVSVACITSAAATIMLGVLLGRVMDASPVAAPRVTSGRLVTFTLQPTPDGSLFVGLNSRRYCQILRERQESLR